MKPQEVRPTEMGSAHGSSFPSTQWTDLLIPIHQRTPAAAAALDRLCQLYVQPLRQFVSRCGYDHHTQEDIVQDFMVSLIQHEALEKTCREKGRFRSFLLTSLKHFLATRYHAQRAQKRGGGAEHLPLDNRSGAEPADPKTAESEFDQRWAQRLLEEALDQLEARYAARGKRDLFADLKGFLPGAETTVSRAELARKWGVRINTVDKAIHDMRRRYGRVLRECVAQTVADPEAVTEEIQYLLKVIGR